MSTIILLTIGLTLLTAAVAFEQDLNSMYDYTPSSSEDEDFAYDLDADDDQQDGGRYPTVSRSKRMFGAGLSRVPPYQWGLLERDHAPEDPDDDGDDDDETEGRPKRTTKRMSIFRERERHIEDVKKRNKKRFWEHEMSENKGPIYYMPAPPPLELSPASRKVGLRELLSAGNGLEMDRDISRFGGRFKAKKASRSQHWYPALELSKRSYDYQDDDDDDGNADDDEDDDNDHEGPEGENVFPVSKRSVKRTDKNVMANLEKILAEDEDSTNSTPSSTIKTVTAKTPEAPPKALNRAKKSWDDYVGIDKRSTGGPKKPMENWAVDYYLKSMARAMSNKRKRGAKAPSAKPTSAPKAAVKPKPSSKNDPNEPNDQTISSAPFHQSTDDRLKGIEKVVLEQAGELIRGEHGHGHPSSDSRRILNRLDVAYNLENLRQALENFEQSLSKMKDEDQDYVKKSMFTKAVAWAPDSGSNASHQPDSTNVNSNSIRNNDGSDDTDDCGVMKSILRHCVGLSRTVGDPAGALVGPCTSHVICHSCANDESSASECAPSFLWSASKVCGDNFRCQTAAGAIRSVIISDLAHLAKKDKHLCPRRHCVEKFAGLDEIGR